MTLQMDHQIENDLSLARAASQPVPAAVEVKVDLATQSTVKMLPMSYQKDIEVICQINNSRLYSSHQRFSQPISPGSCIKVPAYFFF